MDTEEKPQPQVISTPGQPDTIVPQRKNLSAMPLVSDEHFEANKRIIHNFRQYRLEQLKKQQEDAK